ncbi:hypothetical protein [Rhizobium sp. Leaf453]|uniref:hypothetical protein n=1 Tax=Rhizobium sp. Leaf453 TaxID=1736380 RepID=UPI0012E38894|nr:hypothetical protein [Rhizobium sp. Leaf453]
MRRENFGDVFSAVAWKKKSDAEAVTVLRQRANHRDANSYSEHEVAAALLLSGQFTNTICNRAKAFSSFCDRLGIPTLVRIEFWSEQLDRLRTQWK